jgi:structural maintenance of chromosome 3 (chondroitin sulfate proteoglycan 6)
VESTKNALELELNERLKRKLNELSIEIEGMEQQHVTTTSTSNDQRRKLAEQLESVKAQLEEAERESDDILVALPELYKERDECKYALDQMGHAPSGEEKTVEKYLSKRALLLQKKDKATTSIRDLGVLPEEAFVTYRDDATRDILAQLHTVNEELKKYGHVNIKAFEQYSTFSKEKETLLVRKTELGKSSNAIRDLIQVLDQRKDEAIQRTFEQVARNFEQVFEKLVPSGHGKLTILRRAVRVHDLTECV